MFLANHSSFNNYSDLDGSQSKYYLYEYPLYRVSLNAATSGCGHQNFSSDEGEEDNGI